jgi:wobble nucleotide-excising tRNase
LLHEALKQKLSNPSAATVVDPAVEAALRDFDEATATARVVNQAITRANDEIGRLKKEAAGIPEAQLEQELRRFRNAQIRQQPAAKSLCSKLLEARTRKKALEEEKRAKRAELETLAESVLTQYEAAINRLLRAFGANFALQDTRPSFSGGKASSTYQLAIENRPLALGDSKTPRGTPCFRTALSGGDKSALALAFFLARLEQDGSLATKVIVLDDPLSSLDDFRAACTQQEVCRLADRAAQVIVLSHDWLFLKSVHDGASDRGVVKPLQVVRARPGYELREWDIERYCLTQEHHDYFLLQKYLDEGVPEGLDLRIVARAIRPYLEGNLRHRFPGQFASSEMFGNMIEKIRAASPGSPLAGLQRDLLELEALNEYSRQFHHGAPHAASPPPNDQQLRAFVERAIRVVQSR